MLNTYIFFDVDGVFAWFSEEKIENGYYVVISEK